MDALPKVDWIIDAAAQPSVLAGADWHASSRQLMRHNLLGTIHLLKKCKRDGAGFVLLSTSRVYAIEPLAALSVVVCNGMFVPHGAPSVPRPSGLSPKGVAESFSTTAPVSLHGACKLASESLALEYGAAFGFPVWFKRCGVVAGAGQFGRADQGIFAYWMQSHLRRSPLRYIGFDVEGHQVRDCLHPRDLIPLVRAQFEQTGSNFRHRIVNVSGGVRSARSLRQLTDWCDSRFGAHPVASDPQSRPYDLPWVVLDAGLALRILIEIKFDCHRTLDESFQQASHGALISVYIRERGRSRGLAFIYMAQPVLSTFPAASISCPFNRCQQPLCSLL